MLDVEGARLAADDLRGMAMPAAWTWLLARSFRSIAISVSFRSRSWVDASFRAYRMVNSRVTRAGTLPR